MFDSGFGGLTVVRAIMDDLPHESIHYFADTGRFPYGPRPLEEIRAFAVQIARHLVAREVKMVVVACNSATAAALDQVAAAVPVPVVGVIDPAVRAAAHSTRTGRVGLIGTAATVESGAYLEAFGRLGPAVDVTSAACPRFVEFVEQGDTTSVELLALAAEYLEPVRAAEVDTLILGCTHYPFLRAAIHHVVGEDVLLLSSAEETANDVYEALLDGDLLRAADPATPPPPPEHVFESSGDPEMFARLGGRFLGPELDVVRHVALAEPEPV